MQVLIPSVIGNSVPSAGIDSIDNQAVDTEIYIVQTLGVLDSQRKQSPGRTRSEIAGRSACAAIADEGGFVVMQDVDIVHLRTDNLTAMCNYLIDHNDVDAVALQSGTPSAHPRIQCVMYQPGIIKSIPWGEFTPERYGCMCKLVSETITLRSLNDGRRIYELL